MPGAGPLGQLPASSGWTCLPLVVNVNRHANLDHIDKFRVGKSRDSGTSVAGGRRRNGVAAVDGNAAVKVARVIDRAKRRLSNAVDLPADDELSTRSVRTLLFAVLDIRHTAAGRG